MKLIWIKLIDVPKIRFPKCQSGGRLSPTLRSLMYRQDLKVTKGRETFEHIMSLQSFS